MAEQYEGIRVHTFHPLGRIVAFRMLMQSEDRPCVMHAEDDCSADFPCVECPLAPESEKRTR